MGDKQSLTKADKEAAHKIVRHFVESPIHLLMPIVGKSVEMVDEVGKLTGYVKDPHFYLVPENSLSSDTIVDLDTEAN